MTIFSERHLKTGGDPRTFADYATLRDEMNKLTHPARPDVNWPHAEKLCLSLFEQNGVELQTAAWYTLARTQIAGLCGLNEGLAIVAALVSRQWGGLWPQPVHARMDILSALSKRLQQAMRTLTLTYADLSLLYQAEEHLNVLGDALLRMELKHASQFDALCTLMHNAAARLEKSENTEVALPAERIIPAGISLVEPEERVKRVYVAQLNEEVETQLPQPVKLWKPFIAGMLSMLAMTGVSVWGWQVMHQPDPLQAQFAATLAPLPAALSPEQLQALGQKPPSPETGIRQTQRQLTRLAHLPPDWNIDYGNQVVQQALTLWPEQAGPLATQWRQRVTAVALPAENLTGWHQGMTQLQHLANQLNALDEKRGKYMTVSELKSAVFSMTQAFSSAVPVEEQLRLMAQPELTSPDLQRRTEMHLAQLTARYALLKQKTSE